VIGADDLADLYDPDEFGCIVQLIEAGLEARDVNGMLGAPAKSGRLYRSGVDPNAANVRVKPNQRHLQIALADLPASAPGTKVVIDGVEYSIGNVEPLGRLRVLLTLVPFGDRDAPAGDRGKWQASNSPST
jgi:hypothetical protein